MGSSSMFSVTCILHSLFSLTYGLLIMFYLKEIFVFGHRVETAVTEDIQLLIQTSNSFVGWLLFFIGFFLFMVSFAKEKEFQSFFAKGCVLLHLSMALWRVYFESRLEDLAWDWPKQFIGDLVLGLS